MRHLFRAGTWTSKKSCNTQFHKYESPCWHKWLQLFESLSGFNALFHLVASEYNKHIICFVPGCRLTGSWVVITLGRHFLTTEPLEARWMPPPCQMEEWVSELTALGKTQLNLPLLCLLGFRRSLQSLYSNPVKTIMASAALLKCNKDLLRLTPASLSFLAHQCGGH